MNVVVIHTGAIGDLVQAFPALRAVRETWAEAHVTLVGRPERAALALAARLADACVDIETSGLWPLLADGGEARHEAAALFRDADLVLDFFSKGRLTERLAETGRARVVSVDPLPPRQWRDTAASFFLGRVREELDLADAPSEPQMSVAETALGKAREALAGAGVRGRFAAIHPGSGSERKNWHVDRFARLARRLAAEGGLAVAWLLGPAEAERGLRPPGGPGQVVLCRRPLGEVAAVLALAHLYVGNDSGITQVAAAVRGDGGRPTPVAALFGPTDPAVWAPRGRHVRLVRASGGQMGALAADDVWSAVTEALAG